MGTHNSYHIAPPTSVLTFLTSPIVTGLLGSDADEVPGAWEVTMQPLGQQLGDYGAPWLPARALSCSSGACVVSVCLADGAVALSKHDLSCLALAPGNTVGLTSMRVIMTTSKHVAHCMVLHASLLLSALCYLMSLLQR